MLDLSAVSLSDLVMALDDHSAESSWWFDPHTGECEFHGADDEQRDDPEERGLVWVEPLPSSIGYRDMEDFIQHVRDPRARDLLARAIEGRGAFRRFKDTLFEFPDLREGWFAFRDTRMERRAIEWLAHEELIDAEVARRAIDERPDPDLAVLGEPFDAWAVATAVAADLRGLYGERLVDVLLFGSWARGDAHPESDIDLLVVLDPPVDQWGELRRMDPVAWKHSLDNDTVVTVSPVGADEFQQAQAPVLRRVLAEGRRVA